MIRQFKCLFGPLSLFLLALFVSLPPLAAQESNPPPPPQNPSNPPKPAGLSVPAIPDDKDNDDDNVPPPQTPPNPYTGAIKDAGTGLPLLGDPGTPLRWGDFSISTFQFVGIRDRFDPQNQPSEPWTNLDLFTVGLMFNHYIKKTKSRIVLQYLPQAAIVDGQFHANGASNNDVVLGTTLNLTPRFSVTLQDSFMNVHSNPLIPQDFLTADGKEGAIVQNNFLDTAGSFWADTAEATVQYAISPRMTVTFTPQYRYAEATNNQANYLADGQSIAGVGTLGYALSPHRTIGVTESYQYLTESGESASYETTGLFYKEQLARALWVTGNIGAQRQSFADLPNADNWGFAGGFSVIANITNKMPFSVAYMRGVAFNNFLSLQKEDRVDASIAFPIFSRLSWNNSVGYLRELGGNPTTHAKYGTSELAFRVHGHTTLFSTFAYTVTNTSTAQLLSGERVTLAFGVRWAPPMLFGK